MLIIELMSLKGERYCFLTEQKAELFRTFVEGTWFRRDIYIFPSEVLC